MEHQYEQLTREIHSKIRLDFGSMNDEFPEQMMSVKYLRGHEKVLELGGNIGRNSMIIAYILAQHNNSDFVSLETCRTDAEKLCHNRDLNGFKFHVENAALSQRPLVQNAWNTLPCENDVPSGWIKINTITWQELNYKYKIAFDTLVIDCEGAFYYILCDTPEILDNMKLVIMENDYFTFPEHKLYVQNMLREKGFVLDYQRALDHMNPDFYQVWIKPCDYMTWSQEIYDLVTRKRSDI